MLLTSDQKALLNGNGVRGAAAGAKFVVKWQYYDNYGRTVVPFRLDPAYTEKEKTRIKTILMNMMQKLYNCINFYDDTNTKFYLEPFINITKHATDCASRLGVMARENQPQEMRLAAKCLKDTVTVQRVFMYALGFVHEHQRNDRDMFVDVFNANMTKAAKNQYEKLTKKEKYPLGEEYDLTSIMHNLSKQGGIIDPATNQTKIVMLKKDGTMIRTTAPRVSANDIVQISKLYSNTCPAPKKITCDKNKKRVLSRKHQM